MPSPNQTEDQYFDGDHDVDEGSDFSTQPDALSQAAAQPATFRLVSVPLQNQAGKLYALLRKLASQNIIVHGLTVVPNGDVVSIRLIVNAPRKGEADWPSAYKSIQRSEVVVVEVNDDVEFLGACRAFRHAEVNIESVIPLFAPKAPVVLVGLNIAPTPFDPDDFSSGQGPRNDSAEYQHQEDEYPISEAHVFIRPSLAKWLDKRLPLNNDGALAGMTLADFPVDGRGDMIVPEHAMHRELILHIEDSVGSLFEACDVLAKADVRIWSARVEGKPPEAFLRMLVSSVEDAKVAFEAADMEVFTGRVLPFDLDRNENQARSDKEPQGLLGLVKEISLTLRNVNSEGYVHEGGIDITDLYPLLLPHSEGTVGRVAFVVSEQDRVQAIESLVGSGFRIL